MSEAKTGGIYKAIARVQAEMAREGISKDRSNQQQNYKFRGIDDVYNALAPHLANASLVILPRMLSRELTERSARSGGVLYSVVVAVEYDFVSAEDGSKHTVGPMYGEAMDSADKATNKAMSAAYKYACVQTFCIPTEAGEDADATTHEVAPRSQQQAAPAKPQQLPAAPNGTAGKPVDIAAWLKAQDARLVGEGLIRPDELRRAVGKAVRDAGHSTKVSEWDEAAKKAARERIKSFEAEARARAGSPVSADLLDALDDAMRQRGIEHPAVFGFLGVPVTTTPSTLTGSQVIRALAWVEAHPQTQEEEEEVAV